MGTVTLEFIGLFLFNSNANNAAELRVAVIDADRDDVNHGGKALTRHKASFIAQNVRGPSDWPVTDGNHFELAGSIGFETSGPLLVSAGRWALPRIANGCPELQITDTFFEAPARGATHAVITVRSGELCGWRFSAPLGGKGAINTRVTIANPDRFVIRRDDGKQIELDMAKDSRVVFTNTEHEMTPDDRDWYWYYVATGQKCAPDPNDEEAVAPCVPPPDLNPLSLGCSNSQWP